MWNEGQDWRESVPLSGARQNPESYSVSRSDSLGIGIYTARDGTKINLNLMSGALPRQVI